jgi:hypothetical protein
MEERVWDGGARECRSVMGWIGVQNLPWPERVQTSTRCSIIRSHGGLYGEAQLTWREFPKMRGFSTGVPEITTIVEL